MIDKLKTFFDANIYNRIISGIFFVIPFIYFIIQGGYLFVVFFLLILSIIIYEFMSVSKTKLNFINKIFILFILIISIFHFIFLRIANDVGIEFYILYIVAAIWIFDSFSLIGGKLIGGKKLFPKISPNKTYSGLIVGLLSLLIFSITFMFFLGDFIYVITLVTLLIGLLSFLGDALESYLKRYLEIKDFGNLLPGHGGLLDRMDAFILIFFVHLVLLSFNFNFMSLYV